jgi:holo-[acyl-carrier protein] synthase
MHKRFTAVVNVIGHGIDLVEVAALQRWIEDPRDPLVPRCFVQAELNELGEGPDRIERLAGRFAAKEAVLKAIGTGFGDGVAFSDVIIRRAPGSPPEVTLVGGAAKAAAARGITRWALSISHAGGMAMASALALRDPSHPAGASPD